MKVHPVPRKRNSAFQQGAPPPAAAGRQKKLRRLPHIFSKVLELPFLSDADVDVQEDPENLRFVVEVDDAPEAIRAFAIDIYPGVTKVVIREGSAAAELAVDDLELDRWRFRLPPETRPELATANYADGELVVVIPKGGEVEDAEDGSGDLAGAGIGRLVTVQ